MVAQVISFFQRAPRAPALPTDWTQQELAEFYRVESALIRAGIRVGTDRGVSDENEPWFVFYRLDDGDVVIHFARIDGEYLIAGPAYEEIARGLDFTALVRNMVAHHPLIRRSDRGSNVLVHPAALLIAVVGTAFFKTGEARAAESGATTAPSHNRPTLLQSSSNAALSSSGPMGVQGSPYDVAQLPANQAVLILAAALFASDYRVEASAQTRESQAAIAAAAAALDFSGMPATPVSETASGAAPGVGALVAENSAARTISSVLALTAILSTLPSKAEAAPGILPHAISTSDPHAPDTSLFDGLEPQMAPRWALEVRLAWANQPNVEAVELVRSAVGDEPAQKISVIQVEKLPDILADLIARGSHYTVTPSLPDQTLPPPQPPEPTPPPVVTDPVPPPTSTDPVPETPIGGGGGGGGTGGSGGDSGGIITPPPVTPPVVKPPAPLPPFMGFASQELVRQFIDYFVAHTADVEIMTKGLQVLIYDARVLSDPGSIAHLTSMTFNFFDGSSVNLVGDHSSFLHGGLLV